MLSFAAVNHGCLIFCLSFLGFHTVSGCDSLSVMPSVSHSGGVLYAKNADRSAKEAQPVAAYPRLTHHDGTNVTTPSGVVLPQVSTTYAHVGSQPYWGWGYSMGINEFGVSIGNEYFPSKHMPTSKTPRLEFTALDRLVLERAKNASQGIEVLTQLISKYGQGPCETCPSPANYNNLFMLVDPKESCVVMAFSHQWAYRCVTIGSDTPIVTISNHLVTGVTHYSDGAKEYAIKMKFWDGEGTFDFGKVYGTESTDGFRRQRRSSTLLTQMTKKGKITAKNMMEVLSDHSTGEQPGEPLVIDPHWSGTEICRHSEHGGITASSMVGDFTHDDSRLPVVFHSLTNPCSALFYPVFMHGTVPHEVTVVDMWWTFHHIIYDLAGTNLTKIKVVRKAWAPLQDEIMDSVYSKATDAQTLIKDGQEDKAAKMLTDYMQDIVDKMMSIAKNLNATLVS